MYLFTVDKTFLYKNEGQVLIPVYTNSAMSISTGMDVKLVLPDKTEIKTTIKGISFDSQHEILIPLSSTIIPNGTEVWILE